MTWAEDAHRMKVWPVTTLLRVEAELALSSVRD